MTPNRRILNRLSDSFKMMNNFTCVLHYVHASNIGIASWFLPIDGVANQMDDVCEC